MPALKVNAGGVASISTTVDAVGIAIDPVDERRDISHALAACADDPTLRDRLGKNARARWERLHTLSRMAASYVSVIADAAARPAPATPQPAHLLDDGTGTARRLLGEMGMPELPW